MDENRPFFKIFICKNGLDYTLRYFAYMWNIIVIEPDLLPLPVIMWTLEDVDKCKDLEIYAADRHLAMLEKGCRDMGALFQKEGEKSSVVRLDIEEMPFKENVKLSSDAFYLLHRRLSKQVTKLFFNRTSSDYSSLIDEIEVRIKYTQEGKLR